MNQSQLGFGGRVLYGIYTAIATVVSLGLETGLRLGLVDQQDHVRTAERTGMWEQGGMAGSVRAGMGLRPVWVHAASVGEVTLAKTLIGALKRARPGTRVLLTCNTATGRELADRSGADEVHYFPIDAPRALRRVLALIQPAFAVVIETELWPTFLLTLAANGTPAALVNARISERTFPRYTRVRALIEPILGAFSVVCARDEVSRGRLLKLGCDPAVLHLVGDLKFDAFDRSTVDETADFLADIAAPVLVAASTHPGEEELALEVFARLLVGRTSLRLVVAPRHPERAQQILAVAAARGLESVAWTRLRETPETQWSVLVVDTVGDLLGFFRGAVGVFLGGSFTGLGGHNLLEPAAFAKPIVCGPHLSNVAAVARDLTQAGALQVVSDLAGLESVWRGWLDDPDSAVAGGQSGRAAIENNRGALEATIALLEPFVPALEPAR